MTHTDTPTARRAMIDSQLRTSGINDPVVLERMGAVAREEYVPEAQRAAAYTDRAIALGEGEALGAPVFYGALLSEARPQAADSVLVIEGGSGYLAALVAPLAGSLKTASAADAANKKLRGSFSLVLVDGAIEDTDAVAKLVAEGGRVVTGVIERGVTRLASGRKVAGSLALLPVIEMGIPRLAAFDKPKAWSF